MNRLTLSRALIRIYDFLDIASWLHLSVWKSSYLCRSVRSAEFCAPIGISYEFCIDNGINESESHTHYYCRFMPSHICSSENDEHLHYQCMPKIRLQQFDDDSFGGMRHMVQLKSVWEYVGMFALSVNSYLFLIFAFSDSDLDTVGSTRWTDQDQKPM